MARSTVVLAGHAISTAVGTGLSVTALAGWGPALVALFLLAAARSGTWQGPVVFSRADVAFLLMAPIALVDLVRPRLVQALAIATVLGALGGIVALLASAAGIGGVGGARTAGTVIAFALLGLLAVAASWLTERSLKLSSAGAARQSARASWRSPAGGARKHRAAGAIDRRSGPVRGDGRWRRWSVAAAGRWRSC